MKGVVITTDQKITIQDFESPLDKSVGAVVGGHIERVSPRLLNQPYCMIVNENGLLLELRLNPIGSWLYGSFIHGHPIVGNIVIMKLGTTPEGPDIIGLTDEEAEAMREELAIEFHEMREEYQRNE